MRESTNREVTDNPTSAGHVTHSAPVANTAGTMLSIEIVQATKRGLIREMTERDTEGTSPSKYTKNSNIILKILNFLNFYFLKKIFLKIICFLKSVLKNLKHDFRVGAVGVGAVRVRMVRLPGSVGPEEWGPNPEKVGAEGWGSKISRFCSFSRSHFLSLFSLGTSSRKFICGRGSKPCTQIARLGSSVVILCEPPRPFRGKERKWVREREKRAKFWAVWRTWVRRRGGLAEEGSSGREFPREAVARRTVRENGGLGTNKQTQPPHAEPIS